MFEKRFRIFLISTHALTEGDKARCTVLIPLSISTHALTEGDRNSSDPAESLENFNSRPHGGRHGNFFLISVCVAFQLTPSRRATHCHDPAPLRCRFQLTPSRRATVGVVCLSVTAGFQLTPSRRATSPSGTASRSFWISTHALTEGDDFFY